MLQSGLQTHQKSSENPPFNKIYVTDQNTVGEEAQWKGLVYFQENTKKAYLAKLDPEDPIRRVEFNDIVLKNNFKIPQFHRSIITHNGDILLMGGILTQQDRFTATDQVFSLNIEQNQLVEHSQMNFRRCNHSICLFYNPNSSNQIAQEYIYAIGGCESSDESSSTNQCERLSTYLGQWQHIPSCKTRNFGSSVCSFKNYICQFGGKIDSFTPCNEVELFDSHIDQWIEVSFQISDNSFAKLPYCAASLQVSENQVILFGGTVHDVRSDQCFNINLQEVDQIVRGQSSVSLEAIEKLPKKGTFTIPPILQSEILFSIQNSIIDQQVSISFYNRKPIMYFNGVAWKEL